MIEHSESTERYVEENIPRPNPKDPILLNGRDPEVDKLMEVFLVPAPESKREFPWVPK